MQDARTYLGLKQEEVSKYLGVPRSALSEMEAGKRKIESIELTKLANIYKQTVAYFIGEDEAVSTIPVEALHIARQAADLSSTDREELSRFTEYLRARSQSEKE